MDRKLTALAFLPDPADLNRLFPGWPAEMRLALWLDPAGRSAVIPFAEAETDSLGPRLCRLMGAAPGGLALAPELPGQRTVRLLFSEEQMLLAMIAEQDPAEMLAAAEDYLLNWRFAAEEGLDPEALTAPAEPATEADAEAREAAAEACEADPSPGSLMAQTLTAPAPDAAPQPPARAAPVAADARPDTLPPARMTAQAVLMRGPDGSVILRPEGTRLAPRPLPEGALRWYPDLHGLTLALDAPEAIAIAWILPADRLPPDLLPDRPDARRPVRLSRADGVLMVRLVERREPAPEGTASPAPSRMKRLGRGVTRAARAILLPPPLVVAADAPDQKIRARVPPRLRQALALRDGLRLRRRNRRRTAVAAAIMLVTSAGLAVGVTAAVATTPAAPAFQIALR